MGEISSVPEVEIVRYSKLPKAFKVLFAGISILGLVMALIYLFKIRLFNFVFLDVGYYFAFIGLFGSAVFLILPARKKDKEKLRWYDIVIALTMLVLCAYFFSKAMKIALGYKPNIALGIFLYLAMVESARRTGGWIYAFVVIILGLYPVFADHMPGMFYGKSFSLQQTLYLLTFTPEGLTGLVTKVLSEILVGYLVFAGVLIGSGAGDFFIKVSLVLLGRFRGGPAKVSVVSSGLFGSLSGSIMSNIVATGTFTIPTMKRIGYPAHYAGAVEACASTGGAFMPPIMGAVAFIMAQMIGVPYSMIAIASFLPAVLYYWGMLMQVDAYAGKVGLKGLPKEDIPSLKEAFKEGWHFIFILMFLIWGLVYMRWEVYAPWYASGLMVVLSFLRKKTWITPKKLLSTVIASGRMLTQTAGILLPMGFIICGLTVTGVSGSFASGIVNLGGGNIFLILVMGVIACYIMGLVGMSIPAYIFLGVTLAPAAIKVGHLDVFAIHLFIIYYAMLAGITPPVAANAFLAAAMAGASPMKTASQAMRLGIVIYFVPFFFVFNPALLFRGPLIDTVIYFGLCLLGIFLLAGGLEGYMWRIGVVRWWARPLFMISGLFIAFPEWRTTVAGAVIAVVTFAVILISKKAKLAREQENGVL